MKEMNPPEEASDPVFLSSARRNKPDFSKTSTVPFDMLQDWLFILSAENSSRIKKSTETERLFLTLESVNFFCTCCDKLSLPHEVKYTAAVLFDEFMLIHVDQLYTYSKANSVAPRSKDWAKIEDKVGNQLPLRIMSCIQIASKMTDHYQGLRVERIVAFLRESFGRCYDPDAILNSEIRILKTLNYKIGMASPLEYIETLLKLLLLADDSLQVNRYWDWCLVVLDVIFLHRREIYSRLIKSAIDAPSDCITKSRVSYVEADYMLLSTGVICVAACCTEGIGKAQQLTKILQQITRLPADDMTDLCIATIQHVTKLVEDGMGDRAREPAPPNVRSHLSKSG